MRHMELYAGIEDCTWLCETAMRGYDVPTFESFTILGTEDCPLEIALYASAAPTIDDMPVAVYELVTNPHSNLSEYKRTV